MRHIFTKADTTPTNTQLISPRVQHIVIQEYSMELYSKIKDYIPYGNQMQKIVHAFGWTSRWALKEHVLVQSGDSRLDPYEMIRIEMDDDLGKPGIPEQCSLYLGEILRRGIFVELRHGRSLRGTLTRRFQLRRAYCPVFNLSLSQSEPMKLDREQFSFFLQMPGDWCERYLAKILGKRIPIEKSLEQLPMHELLEEKTD